MRSLAIAMEIPNLLSLLLVLLVCGIELPSVHSVEEELPVPASAKGDVEIEFSTRSLYIVIENVLGAAAQD